MTAEPKPDSPATILFDVRGPEPRGPLAERLLKANRRTPEASTDASSVLLIDGQGAGPNVVEEVVSAGLDRPLLLLHAGREARAALNLPITLDSLSDAYLVLPGTAGGPPRVVDFSRATRSSFDQHIGTSSDPSGQPVTETRLVKPGEIPPPQPEVYPLDAPDRFFDADAATAAVADALSEEISAFQRGAPAPRPQEEEPQQPPVDVKFFRYQSCQQTMTVTNNDYYYRNDHAPDQAGRITATYFFNGYSNIDAKGDFQSYILVARIAVGTKPSTSGKLITEVEKFNRNVYLGWFQDSIHVGLNYDTNDRIVLLGTTPNTINRKNEKATTKGFSVDIGFEADKTGPKPKLGLNFKNEVSTTTQFDDWAVGEQSGLAKPDFPNPPNSAPPGLQESVRWRYAVAHPYNGALGGDLSAQGPSTKDFTAQTLSSFEFTAATALEIPADSPASVNKKVTFNLVLGWSFRYYYNPSAVGRAEGFRFFHLPSQTVKLVLDLSAIERP